MPSSTRSPKPRHLVNLDGAWAVTVAINGNGNPTFSASPCARCITTLIRPGMEQTLFCERTKQGFVVRSLALSGLGAAAKAKEVESSLCLCNARSLRLESPKSTVLV